ncbi:RNA-binding protein [Bacillus sp. NPDC094106]|uniref:RNA-binding protein n=1 Tax=Bacillus sp. NPDC094106 TaxID=3363949 RepID=UPI0038245F78
MNTINKVKFMNSDKVLTKEGALAYKNSFKEQLVELFTLGLLNGTFYTKQEDVLKNAGEVFQRALKEEPEFATKCAVYGAVQGKLKLVPTIWMVYVSALEDKSLFKKAFPQVIRNFNMLYNFVEISRKGGIRKGLGRSAKREVNTRFIQLINEYQATRYKNKISDIAKVTRPFSEDKDYQNLMKYISKGELTFSRAQALKFVISGLEEGVYSTDMDDLVRKHSIQLEEVKHSVSNLSPEDKQRLYATVYERLNYNALILNLVALERVFATEVRNEHVYNPSIGQYFWQDVVMETAIPSRIIDMVSAKIANKEDYKRSNMLPFALIQANKKVVTPEFKQALGKLLRDVAQEAFSINKNKSLLVGVDTSSSMNAYSLGGLTPMDIATLFGAMVKKSHSNTNVVAVASTAIKVDVRSQDDVFKMANDIEDTFVGYGTQFNKLLQSYKNEDYVILFTDNEPADSIENAWLEISQETGAKLIIWQLSESGHKVSKDSSVIYVRGYSDRLLDLVRTIIESDGDQMKEIESIEV